MLVELRIRDLAIIDEVDITFSKGLNVLTGETGAGKSIILNAVNMLLGDRSSEESIRTGAEKATVEAVFDVSDYPHLREKLRGVGVTGEGEILIKRIVSRSGRGRVFLNGDLASLAAVSRIVEVLLSIYGQHEHQTLQRAENHIDILDEYGGLIPLRGRFEEAFREAERLTREIASLKEEEERSIRDRELMTFQSQEIAAANLHEGEEETLGEQRRILANAERLFELAGLAEGVLYSGESSIIEKLHVALQKVREITRIDPSLESLAETIESVFYQLEEVAYSLRDYQGKIQCDPDGLEAVERRFEEIRRLKMKYGQTIGEILQFKERIDRQLETFDSNRLRIEALQGRLAEVEQRAMELARALSEERRTKAVAFEKAMEGELSSLGMGNTVFEVRFGAERQAAREKWSFVQGIPLASKGMDTPNVGEEPKPLSRIASGGELSRIMLAMKRIIASAEPGQTLIFDEVDAGIGGAVAEVVGKKLKTLSLHHQVLCVTHLPQIACFADVHHRVIKRAHENRTITETKELGPAERVDEIARMMGGAEITEKTRAYASEMIEKASQEPG